MIKKNQIIFVIVALFLTSCGPKSMLRIIGIDGDEDVETKACPLSFVQDYYNLRLRTSRAIPAKVAVILEGELKYDECQSQESLTPAPHVWVGREQQNIITVSVQHFPGGQRPSTVSYEILDRGDCISNPVSYFAASKVPLSFETKYYDKNPECGSYSKAEVTLDQ